MDPLSIQTVGRTFFQLREDQWMVFWSSFFWEVRSFNLFIISQIVHEPSCWRNKHKSVLLIFPFLPSSSLHHEIVVTLDPASFGTFRQDPTHDDVINITQLLHNKLLSCWLQNSKSLGILDPNDRERMTEMRMQIPKIITQGWSHRMLECVELCEGHRDNPRDSCGCCFGTSMPSSHQDKWMRISFHFEQTVAAPNCDWAEFHTMACLREEHSFSIQGFLVNFMNWGRRKRGHRGYEVMPCLRFPVLCNIHKVPP